MRAFVIYNLTLDYHGFRSLPKGKASEEHGIP